MSYLFLGVQTLVWIACHKIITSLQQLSPSQKKTEGLFFSVMRCIETNNPYPNFKSIGHEFIFSYLESGQNITFHSSGEMLYGIANRELWYYDGTSAEVICTLHRQVEALENLSDDVRANYYNLPEGHDVLIYSFHNSRDFMIRALNTSTCENIDEIRIHTPDYSDIESLVWACE